MPKMFMILMSLFILVSCGKAPEMPDYNKTTKVELLDNTDQKIFFLLPLSGKVLGGEKLWSGDYWPLNQGNINLRWSALTPSGFDLLSPPREVAMMLSPTELGELSPTEKFDLYLGRYDYPLKEEVNTRANRYAEDWEGICNGWAPASMNHNEPKAKELLNPDGIRIPFGSSDIKALLSYYYAFIHKVETTYQLGRRCPQGRWFNWNKDCKNDLNAGSFHVILANKVGLKRESFLVDIDRYKEVWNHPVVSYESRLLGDVELSETKPVAGTVRVIRVKTRVTFVDESEKNTWDPILRTPVQQTTTREYVYNLFLDHHNTILGGEWKSNDRPDFLWSMTGVKKFKGLLDGLEALLND